MGSEVLRIKELRAAAIEFLGPEVASEALNLRPPKLNEAHADWFLRAASFAWGENQKTRRIVDAISERTGITSEQLLPKSGERLDTLTRLDPKRALYEYQDRLRRDSLAILSSDVTRLLVHMPTGSGKTRTTMELIADLTRQATEGFGAVIWLAHSDELCEQAIESFTTTWEAKGTHSVEIVRLWGGHSIERVPRSLSDLAIQVKWRSRW